MKPRAKINVDHDNLRPKNILEKTLCYQSQFAIKLFNKIQSTSSIQLTPYQELCRTVFANTSHYTYSILELIKMLNSPNVVVDNTELVKPSDFFKPIVGLIRPVFETISILKFIEVTSVKFSPDNISKQYEYKNKIAEEINRLVLYTMKFELKKKLILDLPVIGEYQRGEKTGQMLFETIFCDDINKINSEISSCENKYKKSSSLEPKDLWEFIIDYCKMKYELNLKYRPFIEPLEFIWLDNETRDLSRNIYQNLKNDKMDNPWKGDSKEYEGNVMPKIALAYLIYDYGSEVLHSESKYLFQEVRSKTFNMWALWRIIVLAYPVIYHELITIMCNNFDFSLEREYPEYYYEQLTNQLRIWANKIKDSINLKVRKGY